MFKTITVFHIADEETAISLQPANLTAAIPHPTDDDPDKTQWARAGIARPASFGGLTVFIGASNTRMLDVQIRERVLPGKVIRTKLAEKIADIQKRQGRKCGRKEIAETKDEVIAELLPTAFIKPTDTLIMITGEYLIIGSGSARIVDTCLAVLRAQFPHDRLTFTPLCARRSPPPWLHDLLIVGESEDRTFVADRTVILKGTDKSAARYKDVDLQSQAVIDSVGAGMSPSELAVIYRDRISCTLTDQLLIKRIQFCDIILSQIAEDSANGEAVEQFDATVAIAAGELSDLLNALTAEIPRKGGEDTPEQGDEL